MAYQNVGSPRFYINVPEWLDLNGLDIRLNDYPLSPHFRTLPVDPSPFSGAGQLIDLQDYVPPVGVSPNFHPFFVAILGHNFAEPGINPLSIGYTPAGMNQDLVNKHPENTGYSGFSLFLTQNMPDSVFLYGDIPDGAYEAGSVVIGVHYTLPYSPDLKLTMTREMDGVKKIRTLGGHDLIKRQYKAPKWGDAAPWELYYGSPDPAYQNLYRAGRRVWNLSYNYLQGSNIFPKYSSSWTYGMSDFNYTTRFDNTLFTDDTFYAQVIHKTNGGQLPFIFQPDSSNNNTDQFAICKLDMKSLKLKQVADGVYNMKLKIREVW